MNNLNKFTIQKSFAIGAGAGSGKTYTLSRRYINALLGFDYFREDYDSQESYYSEHEIKKAKVKEIVTITYTEAAALEMKGRIFELVSKIINSELPEDDGDYKSIQEANAHLTQEQQEYVLKTLEHAYIDSSNAKISTIHAYCLNTIKTNADIARLDVSLDIIKEDEKQKELSKIIFDVLNNEANRELIIGISESIGISFINTLINKYVSNSKFRSDYDSFYRDSIDIDTYKDLIRELYPLPTASDIDNVYEELKEDVNRLKWFKEFYNNILNFDAHSWKDTNSDVKAPSMGAKKFPITDPIKKYLEQKNILSNYKAIDFDKENTFYEKINNIQTLVHAIKNKYDARLRELGKIDFDTIITKTLEIIPKVNTSYKYIMVDEFQDTNAMQFEIVKNSMKSDTNLFVVGDSKQSIYAFQGAEIEVFNNAVSDTQLFCSIEDMSKNHRSDGVVLDNVNRIFNELLKKDQRLQLIKPNYEAEAQDLSVFKEERKEAGSFRYLITSKSSDADDSVDELDTIVQFISEIYTQKRDDYSHISQLIHEKKKAIAILFDGGPKMLALKQKLQEKGISAKVSASDNFYHTKEINDIFNVLKAIDILSKKPQELTQTQKYYVVGALRSNIIRCDENSIKAHIDENSIDYKLQHYIDIFNTLPLSQAVKYIYDHSNLMGVYAHLDDVEQRSANLYKFLILCKEFEYSDEPNLYKFLSLIENSIYFSNAKEDEAFFKSDNTTSIEICTIHSTKGLAYPLVLLTNSEKSLFGQVSRDSLRHNNFTINNENKEIVGFGINDYEPLSFRVLKELDKLKHLAEKKRLLYVALTRAEHDVVISAKLSQNKDGSISLKKESYLAMICDSLAIDIEELFEQNPLYCLNLENEQAVLGEKVDVEYVNHLLKPIEFQSTKLISATLGGKTYNEEAARLGTITHRVIELYWNDDWNSKLNEIFSKFNVTEDDEKEKIIGSLTTFAESDVYQKLSSGVEYYFELEFNTETKNGFIDLVYFDSDQDGWIIVDFKTGIPSEKKEEAYNKQLDFYKDVLKSHKLDVAAKKIFWL